MKQNVCMTLGMKEKDVPRKQTNKQTKDTGLMVKEKKYEVPTLIDQAVKSGDGKSVPSGMQN